MRRLDLCPQKKLRNPARHLRSLEKWSCSLAGFFPTKERTYKGLWYQKIPVFQKAVAPPHATVEIHRSCAQLLIDAAERLRDARPPNQKDSAKVYAYLTFPDMFASFVEVAFEPNPNLFFNCPENTGRTGDDAFWQEYFRIDDSSLEELKLRIPEDFQVLGTGVRRFDSSWMSEPEETAEWTIGELRKD